MGAKSDDVFVVELTFPVGGKVCDCHVGSDVPCPGIPVEHDELPDRVDDGLLVEEIDRGFVGNSSVMEPLANKLRRAPLVMDTKALFAFGLGHLPLLEDDPSRLLRLQLPDEASVLCR